ncbi:DinB family protein [Aeromicrobium sp. CF4.19]|uniref:mycothiol transferase n=1 Tax=Aeromicrobium sp. CF4.19 TaxID=3373082 RepID=UPI003EE819CF
MSDPRATTSLLTDSFGRIRELVESVAGQLDDQTAVLRLDPGANTPIWLLWHLARVQDDHVAGLAGHDQAWESWRERFDLPFAPDDIGYGHDADQVAAVRSDPDLVAAYHADVHDLTLRYVGSLTEQELARVVDEQWDPPVTASIRLVSVIGDCLQHLGQASFVLGVAGRRS